MSMKYRPVAMLWDDLTHSIDAKETNPTKYNRYFIGSLYRQVLPAGGRQQQKAPVPSTNQGRHFVLVLPQFEVSLTPRESEVLFYVCSGLTNREVGRIIGLSPRTVEYYLKNTRKKTLALNKKELIHQVLQTNFMQAVGITQQHTDESLKMG